MSFTGFNTEYEPMADIQPLRLHLKEIPRLYECLLFNSPNFVMVTDTQDDVNEFLESFDVQAAHLQAETKLTFL